MEYALLLETDDGRRLIVRENRLASDRPGTGIDDPHRLLLGTPGRNRGLSGPSSGAVVSRSDKGGALWQFVYNEGALRRVSVELRYGPDRQTNPELVVPNAAGLKEAITQADARR